MTRNDCVITTILGTLREENGNLLLRWADPEASGHHDMIFSQWVHLRIWGFSMGLGLALLTLSMYFLPYVFHSLSCLLSSHWSVKPVCTTRSPSSVTWIFYTTKVSRDEDGKQWAQYMQWEGLVILIKGRVLPATSIIFFPYALSYQGYCVRSKACGFLTDVNTSSYCNFMWILW